MGSTIRSSRALGTFRVDVFATTLPTLEFRPGVHVNYAETVLPMRRTRSSNYSGTTSPEPPNSTGDSGDGIPWQLVACR